MSQHILLFQKTKMSDQYLPYHLMQFHKLKNVVTRYFYTKFTETSSTTAWTVYTNANLFLTSRKTENWWIYAKLTFLRYDFLVKKGSLHRNDMAAIPKMNIFDFDKKLKSKLFKRNIKYLIAFRQGKAWLLNAP